MNPETPEAAADGPGRERPRIAFEGEAGALSQVITLGHADVTGAGGDLRLVVDGSPRRLAYNAAHPGEGDRIEATAEDDDVHAHSTLTPAPGRVDVVTTLTALRPLGLSAFEHAYSVGSDPGGGALDDLWIPHLKGGRERLVGTHALRTPCLAAQRGNALAAIVPDLDALEGGAPLPPVLDFELPGTLRIGFASHRTVGHVAFRREPGKGLPLAEHASLRLAFAIHLADGVAPHQGLGVVLRAIWSRFGEQRLDALDPQTLPFADFARYAYDAAFDRYELWREIFVEEGHAGGLLHQVERPHLNEGAVDIPGRFRRRMRERFAAFRAIPFSQAIRAARGSARVEAGEIRFATESNQLRTAYGMAHFGEAWRDERLHETARAIARLALTAPTEQGLFPAVCAGTPDRAFWIRGTRGRLLERRYALADLSESGRWMLLLAGDFQIGKGLIDRARGIGEALLRAQDLEGAIPEGLEVSYGAAIRPTGRLRAHAPTSAGGALLVHLALACGERRFLEGARAAGAFVVNNVWPDKAWSDFETDAGCAARSPRWRDRETGLRPQGTFAMAWAVDLLLGLREAGDGGWLDPALAILDELLLHQQIWNAPFLRIDTRGGFGAGNLEGRWNDARSALFAPLLLRAYEATGRREYALRAAAALRASFTLLLAPENARVAPGNVPGMTEADWGGTPDGYGHAGVDAKAPGILRFDWGSGSACAAAAWTQRRFGDLFVDVPRAMAFGLNGCRVKESRVGAAEIDLTLERLSPARPAHRTPLPAGASPGALLLRVRGETAGQVRLRIDGRDLGHVDRRILLHGLLLPLKSGEPHHPGS